MFPKHFYDWMPVKQSVHEQGRVQSFREREIWWCSIGCNVGWEEDGKHGDFSRPVLVIRKFTKELFWGIPLTSKLKSGPFYHQFSLDKNMENSAILSQLRVLDTRRLIRNMGMISKNDFIRIQEKLIKLIKSEAPCAQGASSVAY